MAEKRVATPVGWPKPVASLGNLASLLTNGTFVILNEVKNPVGHSPRMKAANRLLDSSPSLRMTGKERFIGENPSNVPALVRGLRMTNGFSGAL